MCQNSEDMVQRGFVVSVDALFALLALLFFLTVISSILFRPTDFIPLSVRRTAMDVLTVLENTNSFLSPNQTFDQIDQAICLRLEIFKGNQQIRIFFRQGCMQTGTKTFTLWRSFTDATSNEQRMARITVWIRGT